MKTIAAIILLFSFSAISYANAETIDKVSIPTPEQKLQIATDFLREYDKQKSIVDWKIKIRNDRVVLSKRWSMQRIVLFDAYFIKKHREQLGIGENN